MTEHSNKLAAGAFWMISFRITERLIGLISTVILARLLTPSDFGLVAMAVTVIAFLEIFTMNDFGSAIIQNQNATREDYDTAWSMEVLLSIGASAVLAASAVPASIYFDDTRLVSVLLVLALYPLLDGFYNVGCVEFRKNLEFQKDFVFQVVRKLSGFFICIPLAFIFRNHWALVGGMLAGRAGSLAASYVLHPFRPRWCLTAATRIWRFAKWIMINNALTFLNSRGTYLVLGKFADAKALGLYAVAFDLANLPTSELAMPINRAVFPSYSKVQHDDALMRWGFLSVVGFVALVAFPAGLGVAAIAPVLVPLLLGNQWLDAIPLIQILAIGGSISALQANVESVYFAKGLTRSRAKITALQVMLMLPLAFWLTRAYGVKGAATAYLITSLIVCVVNLTRVCRLININLTEILSCFLRPALSAFIMILSIHYLTPGSPSVEGTRGLAILLFWQLAVGIVVFTTVDFLIWRGAGSPKGPESFVLSFLKKSLIKPQK